MANTLLKIFIILILIKYNKAIIGFNCGSADPAVKTYSLVDTGECDLHEEDLQISNTTIELLQLADFKTSHVIQCKIEIRRTIYHCGMFQPPIWINIHIRHTSTSTVKHNQRYERKK